MKGDFPDRPGINMDLYTFQALTIDIIQVFHFLSACQGIYFTQRFSFIGNVQVMLYKADLLYKAIVSQINIREGKAFSLSFVRFFLLNFPTLRPRADFERHVICYMFAACMSTGVRGPKGCISSTAQRESQIKKSLCHKEPHGCHKAFLTLCHNRLIWITLRSEGTG